MRAAVPIVQVLRIIPPDTARLYSYSKADFKIAICGGKPEEMCYLFKLSNLTPLARQSGSVGVGELTCTMQ